MDHLQCCFDCKASLDQLQCCAECNKAGLDQLGRGNERGQKIGDDNVDALNTA